jgi:hypothetical protein
MVYETKIKRSNNTSAIQPRQGQKNRVKKKFIEEVKKKAMPVDNKAMTTQYLCCFLVIVCVQK